MSPGHHAVRGVDARDGRALGLARNIVWALVITLPMTALMGGLFSGLSQLFK